MLCIFPFEADLYNQSVCARYYRSSDGRAVHGQKIDIERDPNLMGLFPGAARVKLERSFRF